MINITGNARAILRKHGLTDQELETMRSRAIRESDYRRFTIPKATGGTREILAPQGDAKAIQTALLRVLERTAIAGSDAAHAYYHGRSIKTMAQPHVGCKWLVKVDLKDFFPSIKLNRALTILQAEARRQRTPESRAIPTLSAVILNWCGDGSSVLGTGLPMGSPTSPALSNIVAGSALDPRMIGLCRTFDVIGRLSREGRMRTTPIHYTRYADDLCFSSDYDGLPEAVPIILNMIRAAGFTPHPNKTKVIRGSSRQVICGVSVNEVIGKPKNYRSDLRMSLYRTAVNIVTGRCPPGYQFLPGKSGAMRKIDLDQLSGAVAHIDFLNTNQARPLVALLSVIKDLHCHPSSWSSKTRVWAEKRNYGQPTLNQPG